MNSNYSLGHFRNKRIVKILSLLLLQAFLFYNAGFATIDKAAFSPKEVTQSKSFSMDDIGISKDLGSIKCKYKGKSDQLIIHIQDAHCNYEAQTNISKILENLSKDYNINLISVEGADGYIDTSWFKAFPDAEIRKEVADYFMKKGEITGAEFLSITTDYPIKLYGAENRDMYIKNLNAFTSTYPYKGELEKYLSGVKTVLGKLKGYIYSNELKEFDGTVEQYKEKKLPLSDYAKILSLKLKRNNLDLKDYPDFAKLVYTLVYEDKIDFKVVDRERSDVIDKLSKALPKDKLQELVVKSFSFKTGKVTAAEYYQYLKDLAGENGLNLTESYPNLANYVIYTRLYEKIDNENLFNELDTIKNAIKERLFGNDDHRNLSVLWDNVNILLGLIDIKLANKEFNYYKEHKNEFKSEFFNDFIASKVNTYGLAYNIEEPSQVIKESLPRLEDFYEIATKRDDALVGNTLKTMSKEKTEVAILITGGFHTEGITGILEKKGLSYIVVCPNITKDVESPYIQVLTNQRTPFEEILVESAAPRKDDTLLAPMLISRLVMMSSKREIYAIDRIVNGLAERVTEVELNWVRRYASHWIKKSRRMARERDIEINNDILANSFLIALGTRIKEIELSLPKEQREFIDRITKEEFTELLNERLYPQKPYFSLDEVDVRDKTVGIRVDINVKKKELAADSIKKGKIHNRIVEAAKTIKELADKGAKVVILAHQGRPGEEEYMEFLDKHAMAIMEAIGKLDKAQAIKENRKPRTYPVITMTRGALYDENVANNIETLRPGEVLILKNVRNEEENPGAIAALEKLFDFYVIDGFSVAHRGSKDKQLSIDGFLHKPNVAGRLMQKEFEGLSKAVSNIKKPYVMSLGGIKVPDYLKAMERSLKEDRVDEIITGGALAQLLLLTRGIDNPEKLGQSWQDAWAIIGKANVEFLIENVPDSSKADTRQKKEKVIIDIITKLKALDKYGKFRVPEDFVVGEGKTVSSQDLGRVNEPTYDIGAKTIALYLGIIDKAKTVFVKGPLGRFEDERFKLGTQAIFDRISKRSQTGELYSFGGGGDTDKAIQATNSKLTYQVLAGGAALQFLAEPNSLPGLKILKVWGLKGIPTSQVSTAEPRPRSVGASRKKPGLINQPYSSPEHFVMNQAIATTIRNGGKLREVYNKATGGTFVVLNGKLYKKFASEIIEDLKQNGAPALGFTAEDFQDIEVPTDLLCHPGTRGTGQRYKTGEIGYSEVAKRYYIMDDDFEKIEKYQEGVNTLAMHEEKHIQIDLGIEKLPEGKSQEEWVNSHPGCDIRPLMARRLGNLAHMEDLIRDAKYGDAAGSYIDGTRARIEELKHVKNMKKAGEEEQKLNAFIRTVYVRRCNIDRMKSTLTEDYKGYDVIIISSSTKEEADYQRDFLERAFRGINTNNRVLNGKICVLSVVEESEGGQIIGQLNTWRKAVEKDFKDWVKEQNILAKSKNQKALETDNLDELTKKGAVKIAIYHNGGKGERASPATQSRGNSRAAHELPADVLNAQGEVITQEVLLAVILHTSDMAVTNPGNRIDTFWANQTAFGTVYMDEVERSNCPFDKIYVDINKEKYKEKPDGNPSLKDLYDYGTAIIDGDKTRAFIANKSLVEKDAKGNWVVNEEQRDAYESLIKGKGKSAFDYGSFSYSTDMHYALYAYWDEAKHIFEIIEHNPSKKAGISRDIDPALVQILVPLTNGLGGKGLPVYFSTMEDFRSVSALEKSRLVEILLDGFQDTYKKAVQKLLNDKEKKALVYETIEFLLFCKTRFPNLYGELAKRGVGGINLGKDSHWFAYKRLLDMANRNFDMLADLLGENLELAPNGKDVRTPATIEDKIRAEDVRRMGRITSDAICVFEFNGRKITLNADEVKKGVFISIDGKRVTGQEGKAAYEKDTRFGIWIKGSVIHGNCVFLPGSLTEDSVVNNFQGLIKAVNSYVDSTTALSLDCKNSIIYKSVDKNGTLVANKEIVADAYRPQIDDDRFTGIAKGQTRMRAGVGFDPKPGYRDIYKEIKENEKEKGVRETTIKVKDEKMAMHTFFIRDPKEGEDKSVTFGVYDSQGARIGKYTKGLPCPDKKGEHRKGNVYGTVTEKHTIRMKDDQETPIEYSTKNTVLFENVPIVFDKLVLTKTQSLSETTEKNLRKALEQGDYFIKPDGSFITKPESDYHRFGDNRYSFYEIRDFECNRSANDKIEHDVRLGTFVEMMGKQVMDKRKTNQLTANDRLDIWANAFVNGIIQPARHGSFKTQNELDNLHSFYTRAFGISTLKNEDITNGRSLKELCELYSQVFGISENDAQKELTEENIRRHLSYTRLMMGVVNNYTPDSYAEKYGIGIKKAVEETYDVVAEAVIDRQVQRKPSITTAEADKAKENLHLWMHDDRFADYHKVIRELLILAQSDTEVEKELFDSFYKTVKFGTGGRRGRVGIGPNRINPYMTALSTQGHCDYLREKLINSIIVKEKVNKEAAEKKAAEIMRRRGVVSAYDVREFKQYYPNTPSMQRYMAVIKEHCPALEGFSSKKMSEIDGLVYVANGIKYYLPSEVRATPWLSFATANIHNILNDIPEPEYNDARALAGTVKSSSHNLPDNNGDKFYEEDGGQAPPKESQLMKEKGQNAKEIKSYGGNIEKAIREGLVIILEGKSLKAIDKAYNETVINEVKDFVSEKERRSAEIAFHALNGTGDTNLLPVLRSAEFTVVPPIEGYHHDSAFSAAYEHRPNPEVDKSFDAVIKIAVRKDIEKLQNLGLNPVGITGEGMEEEEIAANNLLQILDSGQNGKSVSVRKIRVTVPTEQVMADAKEELRKLQVAYITDPDSDRLGLAIKKMTVKERTIEIEWLTANDNDELGIILFRYIIEQKINQLTKDKVYVLVTTVVSNEVEEWIVNDLAAMHGLNIVTLRHPVGFKFTGEVMTCIKNREVKGIPGKMMEKIEIPARRGSELPADCRTLADAVRQGRARFVMSFEEGEGGVIGPNGSIDKDSGVVGLAVAMLAAESRQAAKTVYEYLQETYRTFGYGKSYLEPIVLDGPEGQGAINYIVKQFKDEKTAPKSFKLPVTGGEVTVKTSYFYQDIYEADGEEEEEALNLKVLVLNDIKLEDGSTVKDAKVLIRASGTEPKVKIWVMVPAQKYEKGMSKETFMERQKLAGKLHREILDAVLLKAYDMTRELQYEGKTTKLSYEGYSVPEESDLSGRLQLLRLDFNVALSKKLGNYFPMKDKLKKKAHDVISGAANLIASIEEFSKTENNKDLKSLEAASLVRDSFRINLLYQLKEITKQKTPNAKDLLHIAIQAIILFGKEEGLKLYRSVLNELGIPQNAKVTQEIDRLMQTTVSAPQPQPRQVGAVRRGRSEDASVNPDLETAKKEANRSLLPLIRESLNLDENEVTVDERTGDFVFVNPELKRAYYDRGRHDATYMYGRGLIPDECIEDKEAFRGSQYEAVYNMLHLRRPAGNTTDEFHLATHFPGKATYEGTRLFKTTGSHFQGRNMDVKRVESGYGLQLIAYRTVIGWSVKAIPLYLGAYAVALPGTIDVVVNLGELNFSDRSFRVEDETLKEIARKLGLDKEFIQAAHDESKAKALMEGLAASGMPILVVEKNNKVFVKAHPLYERTNVMLNVVDNFNPGFGEELFNPYVNYAEKHGSFLEGRLVAKIIEQLTSKSNVIQNVALTNSMKTMTGIAEQSISQSLPQHTIHDTIERGLPLVLVPHMERKPWGCVVEIDGRKELIGENWFSSVEGKKGSHVAVPSIGDLRSILPIPHISHTIGTLSEAIETNADGMLGSGVVKTLGKKPILLKYLTPGDKPRISDLSRQIHDTKNEIWIVTKTSTEKAQIILGFKPEKIQELGTRGAFIEAYEQALVEYTHALQELNALLENGKINRELSQRGISIAETKNTLDTISQMEERVLDIFTGLLAQAAEKLKKAERKLEGFYNFVLVKPGDVISIPAGTPHALLNGVEVIEPQIEGRTLPLEDGARYPIRYSIEIENGRVKSIYKVPAETVFGSINLESKPVAPRIIRDNKDIKVEQLGVFPGLEVHRVELRDKNSKHTDTTERGYHMLIATEGRAIVKTRGGKFELKPGTEEGMIPEPLFIPAKAGEYEVVPGEESQHVQYIKAFVPIEQIENAPMKPVKSESMTAEQIYNNSTKPDEKALKEFLATGAINGMLEKKAVIVVYDTALDQDLHTGQVAQAGERSINRYMNGKLINIRATDQDIPEAIDQVTAELQEKGLEYVVVTIAARSTVEAHGDKLTEVGKVLNVQNTDGRYIPVIKLYETALRIAYDESDIEGIRRCLNDIGWTPSGEAFTAADVQDFLSRGIIGVLPKIVALDMSERAKAYSRAREVLKSL